MSLYGGLLRLYPRGFREEYGEDMTTLYNWLFSRYPVLHVPGVPPPHLYS